jgi:hypothetical protein
MRTVYGPIADPLGHASARGRFWASPAANYLTEQPPKIPIDVDHSGRSVGEVVALMRHAGSLGAVGEVDDQIAEAVNDRVGERTVAVPTPLYWSASRIGSPDDGLVLVSAALTASPASVGVRRPVRFLPGALDHRQAADRWRPRTDRVEHELLTRAANARADRQQGDAIVISEMDTPRLTRLGRVAVRRCICGPVSDGWSSGRMMPVSVCSSARSARSARRSLTSEQGTLFLG